MQTVFLGDVLIVEDNFIIAMDVEALVIELGATQVHLASNCDDALAVLKTAVVSAAILDFNVEGGTSEHVADALIERNIPFVFATGQTDISLLPSRYQANPILRKPYSRDDIAEVFKADNTHNDIK